MLAAALTSACCSSLRAFSPCRDITVMLLHTFPPHCGLHFPGEQNLKPPDDIASLGEIMQLVQRPIPKQLPNKAAFRACHYTSVRPSQVLPSISFPGQEAHHFKWHTVTLCVRQTLDVGPQKVLFALLAETHLSSAKLYLMRGLQLLHALSPFFQYL